MGNGDFGSNGSVHWDVSSVSSPANGVDDLKRHPNGPPSGKPDIGAPQHPGTIQVTLRFASAAAAEAALASVQKVAGGAELRLRVPVRPFQNNPGPKNQWEVSVDW